MIGIGGPWNIEREHGARGTCTLYVSLVLFVLFALCCLVFKREGEGWLFGVGFGVGCIFDFVLCALC